MIRAENRRVGMKTPLLAHEVYMDLPEGYTA